MRRIIASSLAIFHLLFFLLMFALPSPAWATQTLVVEADILNVRSGPGTTFSRVGQVKRGQEFVVLEEKNGWYKIKLVSGTTGWSTGDYVKIGSSNQGEVPKISPTGQDTRPQKIRVTGSSVNVRSGPDTVYQKVGSLNKGTIVNVTGVDAGWFQIEIPGGGTAWIAGWLTEPMEVEVPRKTPSQPVGMKQIVVNVPDLNVRSGPGLDFTKRGTVSGGTRLTILKSSGDWYQVVLENGEKGWVAGWLVEFSGTRISSWKYQTPMAPVFRPASDFSKRGILGKTIVIDPGHGCLQPGGWMDPGAVGPRGLKESDVVLDIAGQVQEILSAQGAGVVMTRTGGTSFSLEERALMANEIFADAFISIHVNASTEPTISGTSTYFYAPLGTELGLQRDTRKKLAEAVQDELVEHLSRNNLGVREDNLAVLRATEMPSILVETVFVSNPEEEALLSDPEFRRRASLAIAEGLVQYFDDL